MGKNYYKILDLTEDANKDLIKKAYLKKIKEFPPDKNPEEFKRIREAYDQLKKDNAHKKQKFESLKKEPIAAEFNTQEMEEIRDQLIPPLTIDDMIRLTF